MKSTKPKPIEEPPREEDPPTVIVQPEPDEAPPPDEPVPSGVQAITLPPEPSAPDPVHPREERVRTLRDCARDLFVQNGGTAEAFDRLPKDEFETWVRRARE